MYSSSTNPISSEWIEPSTGAAPVDPLETLLFATSVGVPPLGLEVEVTVFLGKKHA